MAYAGEVQTVAPENSKKRLRSANQSLNAKACMRYRHRNPERRAQQRRGWAERNRHVQQANSHTHTLRVRYPDQAEKISPRELAEWILPRRGQPCPYCKAPASHIDHRTPLSRGGEHVFVNLQMVCEICNRAKGALTEIEFLGWISALKSSA